MKTSELIALLQKSLKQNGDIDVMINAEPRNDLWEIMEVEYHVTEDGEFPRSWNMPEAFLKLSA